MQIAIPKTHLFWRHIDNKTVIVDWHKEGRFVELNSCASLIWRELAKARHLDSIVEVMLGEYSISKTQAYEDVKEMINSFRDQDLISDIE